MEELYISYGISFARRGLANQADITAGQKAILLTSAAFLGSMLSGVNKNFMTEELFFESLKYVNGGVGIVLMLRSFMDNVIPPKK